MLKVLISGSKTYSSYASEAAIIPEARFFSNPFVLSDHAKSTGQAKSQEKKYFFLATEKSKVAYIFGRQ